MFIPGNLCRFSLYVDPSGHYDVARVNHNEPEPIPLKWSKRLVSVKTTQLGQYRMAFP